MIEGLNLTPGHRRSQLRCLITNKILMREKSRGETSVSETKICVFKFLYFTFLCLYQTYDLCVGSATGMLESFQMVI